MNLKHRVKDNISRIDKYFGRKIYGNTNSFSKNFRGSFDIYANRLINAPDNLHRYNNIASNFKKYGCAYISKYIPKEVVSDIASQHVVLIENPAVYDLREDHNLKTGHARRTIYDANLHVKGMEYLFEGEIKQIVEECYQSYFDIMRVVTHRNYYVEESVAARGVYSNKWHCDARKPSIYKIMVNLSDVSSIDGPFHILNKSRTREMLDHGYIDRNNYGGSAEHIDDVSHMERLIGPQGTAMICNTNECLHKAGKIEKGRFRDLMMIQLIPSKRPLTNHWISRKGYDFR